MLLCEVADLKVRIKRFSASVAQCVSLAVQSSRRNLKLICPPAGGARESALILAKNDRRDRSIGITIRFFSKQNKAITQPEKQRIAQTFKAAHDRFGHLRNALKEPYPFDMDGIAQGRLNKQTDTVDRAAVGAFYILCRYWAEPEWNIHSEDDILKFLKPDHDKLKPVVDFIKSQLASEFDIDVYEGSF